MSYEEIVNGANAQRREARCRRDWMIEQAVRWGGWLVAGLMLAINLAVAVH